MAPRGVLHSSFFCSLGFSAKLGFAHYRKYKEPPPLFFCGGCHSSGKQTPGMHHHRADADK